MNETREPDPVESCLGFSRDDAIERVLRRVGPWVETETPSGNAEAILGLSRRIEAECAAVGGTAETFDAPGFGRNLRITFEGREPGLQPLLVLGHIDTVHPVGTLGRQPFAPANGRCTGPGVYDMKSGIAVVVEALALLDERHTRPRRPIRLLITCDEEIGSNSAKPLFRDSIDGVAAALVPEPCIPDGSVKTRRKGVGTYRIEVTGRAAHAGIEPEKAISATAELIDRLTETLAFADHGKGSTVNVGTIGGGTATNVVAANAWATIDTRFIEPDEGDRMDGRILGLVAGRPGARLEVTRGELRPPLVRTDAVVDWYGRTRELAAGLGVDLGEGLSGGGSDGSLVAAMGVPTLDGLGPNGAGAHSADEHILLADLPFRLALLLRMLDGL